MRVVTLVDWISNLMMVDGAQCVKVDLMMMLEMWHVTSWDIYELMMSTLIPASVLTLFCVCVCAHVCVYVCVCVHNAHACVKTSVSFKITFHCFIAHTNSSYIDYYDICIAIYGIRRRLFNN